MLNLTHLAHKTSKFPEDSHIRQLTPLSLITKTKYIFVISHYALVFVSGLIIVFILGRTEYSAFIKEI